MPKTWEQRVSIYCAYLIKIKKLQSSTVKSYISGIKTVLINDGYEWSTGQGSTFFFHYQDLST